MQPELSELTFWLVSHEASFKKWAGGMFLKLFIYTFRCQCVAKASNRCRITHANHSNNLVYLDRALVAFPRHKLFKVQTSLFFFQTEINYFIKHLLQSQSSGASTSNLHHHFHFHSLKQNHSTDSPSAS